MLREGYLEFLVPIADTGVAAQLRTAIERYIGVHSIVFGTADASRAYSQLQSAGFLPAPPIALQRPTDTPAGAATARFTVVRVPPGGMAEGRIQYCEHHTPELVWQERWLEHPSGALGVRAAFVCVADLDEAAERHARFTGLGCEAGTGGRMFHLQRGRVALYDAATFRTDFAVAVPTLPWIAGSSATFAEDGNRRDEYVAIEVVACVGGCLGGGGEPKSMDPLVLEKRMQAIYDMDKNAPRRRSYENRDIQKLHATELQQPNSVQAHALLHRSYAARKTIAVDAVSRLCRQARWPWCGQPVSSGWVVVNGFAFR